MEMDLKLASAGDDVKVWDSSQFSLVKQYNPHDQNVSGVSWSNDNSMLASVSVHVENIAVLSMKKMTTTILECEAGNLCVDFNDKSRYILSGASSGVISVWDLKSKKTCKTYKDHKGPVTCARFNYNSSHIASGSETGEIILYNVVTGQGNRPMAAPNVQAIKQLQYSRFRKSALGAVSDDGAVNLWDCNTRQLLHHAPCHRAPATGLSFSPINNLFLLSVGLDKRITCHDVDVKNVIKVINTDSPLTSVDIMRDGMTVVVGTMRGKIYQYDLRGTSEPVKSFEAHKSSVQSLRFQIEPEGNVTESSKSASFTASKPTKHRQLPVSPNNKGQSTEAKNLSNVSLSRGSDYNSYNDVFSPLREGYQDQSSEERGEYRSSLPAASRNDAGEGYAGGVFSPLNDINVGSRSSGLSPLAQPFAQYTAAGDSIRNSLDFPDYTRSNGQKENVDPFSAYPQGIVEEVNDGRPGQYRPSLGNGLSPAQHPPMPVAQTPPSQIPGPTQSVLPSTPRYAHQDTVDNPPTSSSHKQVAFVSEDPDPYAFLTASTSDSASDSNSPDVKRQKKLTRGLSGDTRPAVSVQPPTPEGVNPASVTMEMKPVVTMETKQPVVSIPAAGAAAGNLTEIIRGVVQEELGAMKSQLKTIIEDEVEYRADQLHGDIVNLQAEMIRFFQIQSTELSAIIKHYSVNEDLLAEVERLTLENRRLKKNF